MTPETVPAEASREENRRLKDTFAIAGLWLVSLSLLAVGAGLVVVVAGLVGLAANVEPYGRATLAVGIVVATAGMSVASLVGSFSRANPYLHR